MAEEFQAGVCGSTLWNIPARSPLGFSPCSGSISYMGGFEWPSHDFVEMKARSISTDESADSVSDGSMVFQDIQKPQQPDSSRSLFMDSTIQMMGIGLSSSSSTSITTAAATTTSNWNQTLLSGSCSGRSDQSNYHSSILQEDMNSRLNFRQERGMDCPQIEKEWSTMKNFCAGEGQDSTIDESKQTSPGFSLDDPQYVSSGNSTTTCQGFDMSSASYGYPSTLLEALFNTDHPQPQQSLFKNQSMNYPPTTNFNEFSHLAKLPPLPTPSLPKQQPIGLLHSTDTSPFWNASTAAPNDIPPSFFPTTQPQFVTSTFEENSRSPSLTAKLNNELVQDSGSVGKKSSTTSEAAFKRPRIETPSPLPTFKVRKEKLGDRVTALQQLVSPFGKTDTASVLQEAIEYIKFLHDQVSALSTPYMKNGAPIQHRQTFDKLKENEGPKQDLRGRGLCLVPISSTFPVASETTADFWTPTFGGAFH